MPIEIRELIIKADVGQSASNGKERTQQQGENSEHLIKQAVEKTLEILKRREER